MAKNSRNFVWITALAVLTAGGQAFAGGLPLRTNGPATDRTLSGLADGLHFKLARLDGAANPAWTAVVEEALQVARQLGFPAETPITAQRMNGRYVILLEGEGFIAGAEPDAMLGRLLYMLAHADAAPLSAHTAAALSIVDQPLSLTLAALAPPSSP